ncbi:MAG: biotin--[acetyl-CoA-carboxylase] ligase [Firmicutes bacterium]|nr:biotin--[acetyl-CoA-carboxylase] ligase [Bacillota bacterium]
MANPRREYRPDRLYPWEVQKGLATRFTGHWIEYYAELPSTNRRARELATGPASPPEGLLVLAEKQTAGRGRLGRSWFSPAGTGIWMTLLLKPAFPPGELPKLTLLAAAAVARAVSAELELTPLIKWPNDLYLDNRKIAGILAETAGKAGAPWEYLLLGIGINVNQTAADFPGDLQEKAGSLRMSLGAPVDRITLLRRCLAVLEEEYVYARENGFARALAYCRQYSLILGRRVEVKSGDRCYRGKAVAIRDDGSLELLLDDGTGAAGIATGEVSFISPY